ncbi:39S ribosomal protein L15, mitochondrial-like isoform X2 [Gigantopelta aegis]|uniref:39S ribosomal protein L15, mitochondrial-like isoform X2 n=1 Tax=Gigantopelta aegis TaxID=1735272 RepID=UPI001B88BDF5|nr:39S ribosomal protein L15, mitochondrial-like isoform X2 [Gigantopelta aegis]
MFLVIVMKKKTKKDRRRSFKKGRTHGRGHKGQGQRNTMPRLGFEGGQTPFYLIIPKEPYYRGHHLRREYPPLSMLQLQRMIDLGRLDADEPIDLSAICNSRLYKIDVLKRQFGVNLTEEGVDLFSAKVNLEVQWASEAVIAAVERNGGVITTRYFDPASLFAVMNPLQFFQKGVPIPRCKFPPADAIQFYTDPKSRGYLANPEQVEKARFELSQKYGYTLPDIIADPHREMLMMRKDPRQIFYGLAPGWVVNLKDKVVLKPKSKEYLEYYAS